MESNQLTLAEQPRDLTPMGMIQSAFTAAIQQGAALEVVDRILNAQKEMIAHQELIAFNDALARVQAKCRRIGVDRENPQTHSKYATFDKLDDAIRPLYIAENLSLTFDTEDCDKPDTVRVICDASLGGYTRRYRIEMPADGKGAKGNDVMTKTHATGSAISYGKRYLLTMIFNLKVGAVDDDGNAAGGRRSQSMNDEAFIEHQDNIDNAGSLDELHRFYLAAVKAAKALGDTQAEAAFIRSKDARKAALNERR